MKPEQLYRAQAQCKACKSDHVDAINYALATGVFATVLSKRYGIPESSLCRHKKNHIPPAVVAKLRAQALTGDLRAEADELRDTENIGLLAKVAALRLRADQIYDAAVADHDYGSANKALLTLQKNLELTGRLVGQLSTGSVTINQNLIASPSYIGLRTKLLSVLRRHPAALKEVIAAFAEAEVEPATAIEVPALEAPAVE